MSSKYIYCTILILFYYSNSVVYRSKLPEPLGVALCPYYYCSSSRASLNSANVMSRFDNGNMMQ